MEQTTIITLLKNSGIKIIKMNDSFIIFEDPACILPAFDTILHYGWIIVLIFTCIMLFGWAVLYIRNGVKLDSLFSNAKSLLLVFVVLSLVKPIVNFVYGDNLFAKKCDTKQVSLSEVQDLLKQRDKNLNSNDAYIQYEVFDVIDSGVLYQEIKEIEDEIIKSKEQSNS